MDEDQEVRITFRMPQALRDQIAKSARQTNRSMNGEIVARLAFTFEEMMSAEGIHVLSKRLEATTEALESIFFNIRDFDLDQFMKDQRKAGNQMHLRAEAVDFIMREYLSSKGYPIKQMRIPRN